MSVVDSEHLSRTEALETANMRLNAFIGNRPACRVLTAAAVGVTRRASSGRATNGPSASASVCSRSFSVLREMGIPIRCIRFSRR